MQSLVLAGNFRELTNEELYEVNGVRFVGMRLQGIRFMGLK